MSRQEIEIVWETLIAKKRSSAHLSQMELRNETWNLSAPVIIY